MSFTQVYLKYEKFLRLTIKNCFYPSVCPCVLLLIYTKMKHVLFQEIILIMNFSHQVFPAMKETGTSLNFLL